MLPMINGRFKDAKRGLCVDIVIVWVFLFVPLMQHWFNKHMWWKEIWRDYIKRGRILSKIRGAPNLRLQTWVIKGILTKESKCRRWMRRSLGLVTNVEGSIKGIVVSVHLSVSILRSTTIMRKVVLKGRRNHNMIICWRVRDFSFIILLISCLIRVKLILSSVNCVSTAFITSYLYLYSC